MKLIIFIFVFSSFSLISFDRKQRIEIRKNIISGYNNQQYKDIIPMLEEYTLKYPDEIIFQLYLAKSYIYHCKYSSSDNLKKEELYKIREYYAKSVGLFSKYVQALEEKTPGDKNLGDYYFYWGLAEMFSGREDLAIKKFNKSIKLNPTIKENYYNLAILNEKLNNFKESDRFFEKYNKLKEAEKGDND